MKYLFILLILSQTALARDTFQYVCPIDKDLHVEISLLDKTTPTIDLFYKNSKFESCLYENTIQTQGSSRAQIQDTIWRLEQRTCTVYFEAHKDRIKVSRQVNFKQAAAKKAPSYLDVVENHQPLSCAPKK